MEPLSSPILITLGLIFTIFAFIVESDAEREVKIVRPPPLPPPPPPTPRPPASPLPRASISPPLQQKPPSPPSPNRFNNKSSDNASHRRPPPHPQKKHRHSLNTGKKIGLLFAGVAAILQIGVVGFLVFKRRQLLKINDRYDNYSS